MSKTRAMVFGTRTSFSFSFGTPTFSVSPGFASEGLNVIRLTARIAFKPRGVFLLYVGSRFADTDIVYAQKIIFSN